RSNHEELRAEIPERPVARGFAILARREFLPAPAISRCGGGLFGCHHQIRQVGESTGRAIAARPVARGPEGEGSSLRRVRRGYAEISARLYGGQSDSGS